MANATRLLDTSIFIDYLRGNETAKAWMSAFSDGEMAYSVVTAAELLSGCRDRREQDLVEKELSLYPIVHLSGAISLTAWEWYRQFRLSHGPGFLDCLIGQALIIMGLRFAH